MDKQTGVEGRMNDLKRKVAADSIHFGLSIESLCGEVVNVQRSIKTFG